MPGDMIADWERWLRGSLGMWVGGGAGKALSLGAWVLFDLKAKGWNTEVESYMSPFLSLKEFQL